MNTNCLEGMRCPECGNEDKLLILAEVWVAMTDEGSDPFDDDLKLRGDIDYDNDSSCSCPQCGHEDELRKFWITNQPAKRKPRRRKRA